MAHSKLLADALAIWHAGVEAVRPENCLRQYVAVDGPWLIVGEHEYALAELDRILVVGAGKASAGMAAALENVLGARLLRDKSVSGLVCTASGTQAATSRVCIAQVRPAGSNLPTAEAGAATRQTLDLVHHMGPRDLCIVLLSGGGSALWCAPREGLAVDDKVAVARELASAGANIDQLNTVRRALSEIKGGGLARNCRAGKMVVLAISDVPGDDLATLASGPCVPSPTTEADAIAVLEELRVTGRPELANVVAFLRARGRRPLVQPSTPNVPHVVIANAAVAVDAAGIEAERRGYNHAMLVATSLEGGAESVGHHLAQMALQMRDQRGPNCLITAGEPIVTLPDESVQGHGGRNQQLALAAIQRLTDPHGVALVAGGTDGEDGPTDAAGGMFDEQIVTHARSNLSRLDAAITNCDAYPFLRDCGGLLATGPTGTNVGDLRVVVVQQPATALPLGNI